MTPKLLQPGVYSAWGKYYLCLRLVHFSIIDVVAEDFQKTGKTKQYRGEAEMLRSPEAADKRWRSA